MTTTIIHLRGGHQFETPLPMVPLLALLNDARVTGAKGVEIESVEYGPICIRLSNYLGMETWCE